MMKTILLTGATGFIGSHLLRELMKQKYNTVVLKQSTSNTIRIKDILPQTTWYNINTIPISKPFQENKIDLVINLATDYGRRENALLSELIETNISFAVKLAEESMKHNVPYFANIDTHLNEKVSHYAFTKKMGKELLKTTFKNRLNMWNIRLEYIYGEDDDPTKFIPYAMQKLKNNEDLDMTSGEQQLDFTHIDDCISAFLHIIANNKKWTAAYEEFEIGTGKARSLRSFMESWKQKLNSKSIINFGAMPYRANEHMYSQANIKKLQGWKATHTL